MRGKCPATPAKMTISVREFLRAICSVAMSILPTSDHPPSSSTTEDPEVQPAAAPVVVVEQNHGQFRLQWRNVVMAFCCTSALEIALASAQIESQLPLCFHLLSLALLLTFLCLLVANLIGPHFANTAQVLEKIAVVLVATAVVFTIAIPLPLSLKCIAWALYVVALFTVLVSHYFTSSNLN